MPKTTPKLNDFLVSMSKYDKAREDLKKRKRRLASMLAAIPSRDRNIVKIRAKYQNKENTYKEILEDMHDMSIEQISRIS